MNQDDIDPSLRAEPLLENLDDGFSPPASQAPQRRPQADVCPAEPALGTKSLF